METQKLQISDVRLDPSTQVRLKTDNEVVTDYAEAMERGDQFPPVVVFFDGEVYWLADGFHRVYAAMSIELTEIEADIRHGSKRDALECALGENDKHGLRRTNADKRNAVRVMLEDEEWSKLSNYQIAAKCNVHEKLVRRMRPEICIDNTAKPHPTIQTIFQPSPTENLEAIISERLAEERAGMEATIQERVASVEQHYKERMSQAIAERVRMENDAAEQRLARQRQEYEAKLRDAEAQRQAFQEPQPPQVEVREVVPPEVEEKLRAMASELEEIAAEREALQRKLESLQKAGKDLEGIQKQIAASHKSYERLKAKYDADDRRMQEGVALSNAVMEVQDFFEARKGPFERLARDGVLPWMSVPKVTDVGSLCIEIGEMLIAATKVVSLGNPDREGVSYIERENAGAVEL